MKHRSIVLALVLTGAFLPAPGSAQLGKLKEKVKAKVDAKVDKKVDCTLDKIIDKQKCEEDNAAIDAKKKGDSGSEAASAQDPPAGASKAAGQKPGEGVWANFDFVPGDRILFADDFSMDRVGNFPKRLELEGGTLEIVEWPEGSGKRWLRSSSESGFTIKLPEKLPERWTMEFDVTIPWQGMWLSPGPDEHEYCAGEDAFQCIHIGITSIKVRNAAGKFSEVDARDVLKDVGADREGILSRPYRARIQADGNYMKVYLDEQRVANMPNMGRWNANVIRFGFSNNTAGDETKHPMIGNISVNAGGKELYDKLMADGRLAVQGIYFNTGSAVIRPESSGTLAEITAMLKEHADLKLTVEGHTDNVGDAAKNKTLSEQRAAAVVAYLKSHGVSADRLQSAGFGDTKPAAKNDSPEGRQKNRRVELVKM